MRIYVMLTGTLFGLIALAHLWRLVGEAPHLTADPVFVLLTLAAGALSLWAWRLIRRAPKS